jgi:hypothetical protein
MIILSQNVWVRVSASLSLVRILRSSTLLCIPSQMSLNHSCLIEGSVPTKDSLLCCHVVPKNQSVKAMHSRRGDYRHLLAARIEMRYRPCVDALEALANGLLCHTPRNEITNRGKLADIMCIVLEEPVRSSQRLPSH